MCQILTGEHKNFKTHSVKTVKLRDSRQDGLGQVEKGLSEKEALRGRKGITWEQSDTRRSLAERGPLEGTGKKVK